MMTIIILYFYVWIVSMENTELSAAEVFCEEPPATGARCDQTPAAPAAGSPGCVGCTQSVSSLHSWFSRPALAC